MKHQYDKTPRKCIIRFYVYILIDLFVKISLKVLNWKIL